MSDIVARDKLGKELHIGDKVVFMQLGYRNMLVGEVVKITTKTLLISHEKTNNYSTETKQFHDQVVKI